MGTLSLKYLFIIPYFSANATEYKSYSGAVFDENPQVNSGLRHSGKVRTMLHTLVCGDDPNCQFEAKHFFLALRYYGCNCYSRRTPNKWNTQWVACEKV